MHPVDLHFRFVGQLEGFNPNATVARSLTDGGGDEAGGIASLLPICDDGSEMPSPKCPLSASEEALVALLLDAHLNRHLIDRVPAHLVPTEEASAYRVANAVSDRLGMDIGGWKIGATATNNLPNIGDGPAINRPNFGRNSTYETHSALSTYTRRRALSLLSKLDLTQLKRPTSKSPLEKRRDNLIQKLEEQAKLAEHAAKGKRAISVTEVWELAKREPTKTPVAATMAAMLRILS